MLQFGNIIRIRLHCKKHPATHRHSTVMMAVLVWLQCRWVVECFLRSSFRSINECCILRSDVNETENTFDAVGLAEKREKDSGELK